MTMGPFSLSILAVINIPRTEALAALAQTFGPVLETGPVPLELCAGEEYLEDWAADLAPLRRDLAEHGLTVRSIHSAAVAWACGSTDADVRAIGNMARKIGIQISGVCSFLFWPYSLTHNDPARRRKGFELAVKMIRAARLLRTQNLLVVPGAVYIPWLPDEPPVPHQVCDRRAREAVRGLIREAEKAGVYLNIENIFLNGFLHSPGEMNEFVDSFKSERVCVHFDTGNVMQYHFPEHWIPLLGKRIRNVHLKEASKKVHEFNINTFRPLLDGSTNWPAVIEAFDKVGYRGYLTFEYFNPFPHWPESLVHQTSGAMDRMLGRRE